MNIWYKYNTLIYIPMYDKLLKDECVYALFLVFLKKLERKKTKKKVSQ